MSEHLKNNSEKHIPKVEITHEHAERLKEEKAERAKNATERDTDQEIESARAEVEQQQAEKVENPAPTSEKQPEPVYFTRADRERSFHTTMRHVRNQLSTPKKIFSNVIHQKQIEQVSEIAGKTIARPSGIIGASCVALIGIGFLLIVAKRIGFQLSGSEFWILLCIGYLCGLLIELIKKTFTRSNSKDSL